MPPKFTGVPISHSRHERAKWLRVRATFYASVRAPRIAEAYDRSARRLESMEIVTAR